MLFNDLFCIFVPLFQNNHPKWSGVCLLQSFPIMISIHKHTKNGLAALLFAACVTAFFTQSCGDDVLGIKLFSTTWCVSYGNMGSVPKEKIHVYSLSEDYELYLYPDTTSTHLGMELHISCDFPSAPPSITACITCDDEAWADRTDTLEVFYSTIANHESMVSSILYNGKEMIGAKGTTVSGVNVSVVIND